MSFPTLAATGVIGLQVKEAIFAAVASLTFYTVFTDTLTGQRITQSTAFRTSRVAVAC